MARTRCLVPFCKHTTARQFVEWICAQDWRETDRWLRRRYSRLKRLRRKATVTERPEVADYLQKTEHRVWVQLKCQAIERAMGVG